MGIKNLKPITPGQRFRKAPTFEEITKKEPEPSLTEPLRKKGGRNNTGRITCWQRGGGHKRRYRIIDWKRDKHGIEGKVISIEYDPNRSARIALIQYVDGEKRYILWPDGLKPGDRIVSGEDAPIKVGNALPIKNIPLGTEIHNIELVPGRGGKLVRAAGTAAQILAKEGKYAHIRLPSGEIRLIHQDCYATVGRVGNIDHDMVTIGKVGRSRWLGRRPNVRGVAMNPVDHPLGGGEGRSHGGRHPVSPWGMPTKGYKTRKKRKPSDKFIVQRRK